MFIRVFPTIHSSSDHIRSQNDDDDDDDDETNTPNNIVLLHFIL